MPPLHLALAALLLCGLTHARGAWRLPRPPGVEPGPAVRATRGAVWPQVQQRVTFPGYLVLRPSAFRFKVDGESCDLLHDAFKRYGRVLQEWTQLGDVAARARHPHPYKQWLKDRFFKGYLDTLHVQLLSPCEQWPHLGMDEQYDLRVNTPDVNSSAVLRSNSIWGILRGLETFTQLAAIHPSGLALILNSTTIEDYPRFPHRGLLLDTSRHYLSVSSILQTLDAMEVNKLNVLHWHIVDDQSFPYQSNVFPELSEKGAYDSLTHIYTRNDIRRVVEHARARGIRVIPEFDTPGHTRSWGEGMPELLTTCYAGDEPDGTYGPINPIDERTYKILRTFFKEVVELFPEKYVHLGGDEVSFDCWASNPDILNFMESHNMSGRFTVLEEMYIQKLIDITKQLNASSLVWQEVFDNGVKLDDDTVVHVWFGNYKEELHEVTEAGHPVLLSTCWYLDHLATGGDWQKFYACDPHDFSGTEEQKKLVLGGEACMWGEVVDESNLHSRVWPRASAAAEKLWSAFNIRNVNEAAQRLEEHTCRMKRRGIPAQPPNGPGYCPY